MVDEYRTDEEQIEAIKNWWDENGKSTLFTIVLAVGATFGWQQWQSSKQESLEAASNQYQQLLSAIQTEERTASQTATAEHLVGEIKQNWPKTTYAHFAALQSAKMNVQENDLDAAQQELQWVINNNAPEPAITAIARLRLARVTFAKDGAEAALAVIDNVETGPYKALYAEFRGDLHDELGNLDLAEQQYSLAKDASGAAVNSEGNPLLELKHKSVTRRLAASDVGSNTPTTAEQPAVEESATEADDVEAES
ncbi:MAG: tetratricopeptide repeat protein [Pseudomonadota bacterium]